MYIKKYFLYSFKKFSTVLKIILGFKNISGTKSFCSFKNYFRF